MKKKKKKLTPEQRRMVEIRAEVHDLVAKYHKLRAEYFTIQLGIGDKNLITEGPEFYER